jgi:hypothetical protein
LTGNAEAEKILAIGKSKMASSFGYSRLWWYMHGISILAVFGYYKLQQLQDNRNVIKK